MDNTKQKNFKRPQSGGLVKECDVPDEVLQMWVVALEEMQSKKDGEKTQ